MLRAILAVVGGYAAMFIFIFVVFTGAYLALGTAGAFQEGSFEVSTTWIVISFVVGLVAAIIGGFLCVKIAGRPGPLKGLIGLLLVLGLAQAFMTLGVEDPGPRGEDLSNMEAMMYAVTPTWVAFGNVIVGVIGLLMGGRMAGGGSTATPTAPVA